MNTPIKWKSLSAVFLAALLTLVGSARATLVITGASQNPGTASFDPSVTWPVANNSLIAGLAPTTQAGNFLGEANTPGVSALTDGAIGPISSSAFNVYAAGGPSAGTQVIYTLTNQPFGYNLTNITVYSGWANGGRSAQGYTVLYSTIANPTNFLYLTNVTYTGGFTGNNPGTPIALRVQLTDDAGGVIASNVAAIQFDFQFPTAPNGENNGSGYTEITVQGNPAANLTPVVSIIASDETGTNPFTPDWILETNSLISTFAPSTALGNFTLEGATGTAVLTDGIIGTSGSIPTFATCGAGSSSGRTLIYTLTNVVNGTDVTNIVVYNGWGDNGRDGQYYLVSYSTVAAPTTYLPITTVYFLPKIPGGVAAANRLAIFKSDGSPLASAVANIKFDFAAPFNASSFNNGYQGYSEIVIQGKDTTAAPPPPSAYLVQDVLPTHAESSAGDKIVFNAVYSNIPPVTLQWQKIAAGATNNVNAGVVNVTNNNLVTSTLTLNNVSASDSGSYRLEGLNATNVLAQPSFSTAGALAVGNASTNGNVVINYSGQTGPLGFYPPWTVDTNHDLIFGSIVGVNATAGPGSYSIEAGLFGDPTILTDGIPSSDKSNMVSLGWVNVGAGQSMTYILDTSSATSGFEITNISVFGGWPDDGRDELKYQVLYSTVSAPSTFVPLLTEDYNPTFTSGEPVSARTILTGASGPIAHNVAAVQFNFNMQSKNNWNGYSEISVGGTPSLGFLPAVSQDVTPLTAEDAVGGSLILIGGFTGADKVQWQQNGVNVPGATNGTLTLNNLQLTNAGSYRLLGINVAGTNATRSCAVVIDPAPVANNNVKTSVAYQTSDVGAPNTFGPTWDTSTLGLSLIAGQNPPNGGFGTGDFIGGGDLSGGLGVLTDGNYGFFAYDKSHPAFASGGAGAGQFVTYTLGADPNGYTVTNIQIAGGWNDNGRDSQFYTVSYSTVVNPGLFLPIASVTNDLTSYGVNDTTVVRTTFTPATGVLASNAYAIMVDFTVPPNVPNGYSGYSEISVFGAASTSPDNEKIAVSVANENTDTPDWTIETNNLIAGQLPSSTGAGSFAGGFGVEGATEGLVALTDGTFGPSGLGTTNFATAGGITGPGSSVTYTSATGWDLTNIVVYSGWTNYNRDGQFYNISYSTVTAPNTFLPLTTIIYNPPPAASGSSANRVAISPTNGATKLAANVSSVKFDFSMQTSSLDNGYSGYAEIVLQGANLVGVVPPRISAAGFANGKLILTGTGGAPNHSYSVLTTTNLLTPLSSWTVSTNGTLDGSGAFSNAIPINGSQPAGFFRLKVQ